MGKTTNILIIRAGLIAVAAALAGCGAPSAGARQQLISSAGLTPEEGRDLSTLELAIIKNLMESSDLTDSDRRRRIQRILQGRSPVLAVTF